MPKPPPIYITDVKNISPLIWLLEQIAKQYYEIKALADNQVEVQPTSESYRTLIKALAKKFHTYKLSRQSSQMVARLSALRTRRTLLPRNIIIFMFLVFISVRGRVKWRMNANESKSIHITFTTQRETCPPPLLGPYKQCASPPR
jgi:hypothetical protein